MQKVTETTVRCKIAIGEADVYFVGEMITSPYIVAEQPQSALLWHCFSRFKGYVKPLGSG